MNQNYPRALTSEDIFKRINSKEVKDALSVINTYNNGLTNTYGIIKKYITYMKNYDSATQYYLSGTPSLETKPTSDWEETDYSNHLNDLYYDTENGIVFIFKYNESNDEYYWEEVNDDTLPSVMATAYEQADVTQDNMRNMYYAEPTVPYSVGDIWLSGDNIYRCIRNETEDSQFYMEDWVNYQQYDDNIAILNAVRVLNQFAESVVEEYVTRAVLEITTEGIYSEVAREYVGKDEIISTINQSPEAIEIQANRISLIGGELAKFDITNDGLYSQSYTGKYDMDDVYRGLDIYLERIPATQADLDKLDIDQDGQIQLLDVVIVLNRVLEQQGEVNPKTALYSTKYNSDHLELSLDDTVTTRKTEINAKYVKSNSGHFKNIYDVEIINLGETSNTSVGDYYITEETTNLKEVVAGQVKINSDGLYLLNGNTWVKSLWYE